MNLQTDIEICVPEEKGWYTVEELKNFSSTTVNSLWGDYFPRGTVCAITGPSDCGKSTLMKQFALAITSRQTTFLGKPLSVVHGRVCYLSTEDEQIGTWRVLEKQMEGSAMHPLKDDSLIFIFDFEQLIEYIKEHGNTLDCVIIDTFPDTFAGNPNNLVDVRSNVKKFSDIARQYNLTVVLVHHNVKNSEKGEPDKNKMNGSQALEAKLRCVLELRLGRVNSNERLLTVIKCNHLPQEQKNIPQILELNGEHLLFTHTGEQRGSVSTSSTARFDREVWIQRMLRCKEKGMSYSAGVDFLKEELPTERVPSETWFKEHCKEAVGQPDIKASDRPTTSDPLIEALWKTS